MKRNGYRPTHRNKWLFLEKMVLSSQALQLLEYYADLMDFDHSHPNYGIVKVDFEEIGRVFHKTTGAVRNWHNELEKKGFISLWDKRGKLYRLVNHERYVGPSPKWKGKAAEIARTETNQPIEKILQHFGIDFQSVANSVQPVEKKQSRKAETSVSIALGS